MLGWTGPITQDNQQMKLAFTNCNSMCTLVTVHMDSTLLKNKSIKSEFLTEKKNSPLWPGCEKKARGLLLVIIILRGARY